MTWCKRSSLFSLLEISPFHKSRLFLPGSKRWEISHSSVCRNVETVETTYFTCKEVILLTMTMHDRGRNRLFRRQGNAGRQTGRSSSKPVVRHFRDRRSRAASQSIWARGTDTIDLRPDFSLISGPDFSLICAQISRWFVAQIFSGNCGVGVIVTWQQSERIDTKVRKKWHKSCDQLQGREKRGWWWKQVMQGSL